MILIGLLLTLQASPQQAPPQEVVRPCAIAAPAQAARKPLKGKKSQVSKEEDASADKCVEVHSLALDAQEYLQKYVREKRWTISHEHVSEEMWNFSVELSPVDLSNDTKAQPEQAHVDWSRGRALVRVATTALPDGYTRVLISAHFEGFGESEDKFATQRESWPLESSGALESQLISALQARVGAAH